MLMLVTSHDGRGMERTGPIKKELLTTRDSAVSLRKRNYGLLSIIVVRTIGWFCVVE